MFSHAGGKYKVNKQNSILFLFTGNKQLEIEIKNTTYIKYKYIKTYTKYKYIKTYT